MKKIFLVSCTFILAACGNSVSELELLKTVETKSKKVIDLQSEKFKPKVELSGNIKAAQVVSIDGAVSGRVAKINVNIGDSVKKGQILAQLSPHQNTAEVTYSNAVADLVQTKANVGSQVFQAELEVKNAEKILQETIGSQEAEYQKNFQQIVSKAQSSHFAIRSAYQSLDNMILASPESRGRTSSTGLGNIGSNQTISKSLLRSNVNRFRATVIQDLKDGRLDPPKFKSIKESTPVIMAYAEKNKKYLETLRSMLLDMDLIALNSTTHASFSLNQRQQIQSLNANEIKSVDGALLDLANSLDALKALEVQFDDSIVQARGQIKNSRASLKNTRTNADSQISAAQGQVRAAGVSRQELIIKAPFSGVVTQKHIDVGQLVGNGTALFEVSDLSALKIETEIPDIWAVEAETGLKAEIRISGMQDEVFLGTLTRINPSVDATTRKVGIEVTFDEVDSRIKVGLIAKITFILPEESVFFIPQSYLKSGFDGSYVLLENGTRQPVDVRFEDEDRVQIWFDGMVDGLKITK